MAADDILALCKDAGIRLSIRKGFGVAYGGIPWVRNPLICLDPGGTVAHVIQVQEA